MFREGELQKESHHTVVLVPVMWTYDPSIRFSHHDEMLDAGWLADLSAPVDDQCTEYLNLDDPSGSSVGSGVVTDQLSLRDFPRVLRKSIE